MVEFSTLCVDMPEFIEEFEYLAFRLTSCRGALVGETDDECRAEPVADRQGTAICAPG